MPSRILLIEDDEAFRRMLGEALADLGHEVVPAGSAEDGVAQARFQALEGNGFDLILSDVRLPGMTGVEAIPLLREASPGTEIIVMTAYTDHETALDAIRQGASDFFTKPFRLSEMQIVVGRTLEKRTLKRELGALREALRQGRPGRVAVGESPAMRAVLAFVERVAPLDTSVLILGESGTGKEVVADLIHEASPRAAGPFVKVNCASIPENLLESELFGHEKGAFTGAFVAKAGKFELAKGGSLLLDEIGDMPLHLQPKLLRAVEQKQSERVGGAKPLRFDVRIIAATNVDLARRVADKAFREDLYYRLNVAAIHLPALRERKEDIPLLAAHFVRQFNERTGADIPPPGQAALDRLMAHNWPGNVRQFANVVERAAIFSRSGVITAADVEMALAEGAQVLVADATGQPLSLRDTLNEVERSLILAALRQAGGVQTRAAKALGITPTNLWNKIQKHAIDPAEIIPT
ncbi:MAG: sigma-54 dependent transcriptional regulator [Humidesulfovibrio sp.]|uniref:sigma-54-dependent transcriptional regulator n=1 Tax=Humidesulfovibrio sp. TaxID=2910988 RepID=UPI0027F4D933|nr:sigma-54 dependent transcriptional regulator [Humidesulfovibrio sp.]MDQ7836643.1 sigma-54 dependent transcriptional regulator [Humidesulfovibrio sp.]